MGNVPEKTVICKCLNFIELSDESFPLFNYRAKFTLVKAVKLLIEAEIHQRADLGEISDALHANKDLQKILGLDSISPSQISRTLNELPLEVLQQWFLRLNQRLKQLYVPRKGIPGIGRLRIIDSTTLSLPEVAGKWAYCSTQSNGVKIHTQLVVADPDTVYPGNLICSTRGVADSEVALDLVVDPDAIYVMDRGYIVYRQYKHWKDQQLRFVARIQKNNKTRVVHTREVVPSTCVQRDADVMVGYKEQDRQVEIQLRLVEYLDEKGRLYRVLTNVWDLTAEQISEIYRYRWMIELFFKWMKQHLSLVHLYSRKPKAVWNQIYLAMIAQTLLKLVFHEAQEPSTLWQFLKRLRLYMNQSWEAFMEELHRAPTKSSKGRRKKSKLGRPPKQPKKSKTVKLIIQ